MRKLLAIALLLCGIASGQALYDVTASTDLTFTASGATVPNYTLDFRFVANTSLDYIFAGPDLQCRLPGFDPGNMWCYVGSETGNPIVVAVTNGTEYRARYIHDFSLRTSYLYLRTPGCVSVKQNLTTVAASSPLAVTGTWTIGNGQKLGFFRITTGLGSATDCPTDRPSIPGDIFDFGFEDGTGSGGSLASRTNGYTMMGTPSYTASATPSPISVITGSAPKLVGKLSTSFTLSADKSRSFFWPGTGAPSSYSWTQTAGPGTCTITNGTTATATLNCDTASLATDYQIQLSVTDPTPTTVSSTSHLGVVTVDANDNVVISNTNYSKAIADGKPMPRYGSSNIPFPWYTTTEASTADQLGTALASPPHYNAGPGTVSLNLSTGVLTGSGTDFAVADVGSQFVILWDPDGDSSYSGRYVATVASRASTTSATLTLPHDVAMQMQFPAGLSWGRMIGAGTCGTLTPTVSGGQVTAISGAASCSGFSWWLFVRAGSAGAEWQPQVSLTLGGASGCSVTANVLTSNTTSDPTKYGTLDPTTPFDGLPCGTGYASAPTVTVIPMNEYRTYDVDSQNSRIYNYYEAGLGIGRLALRTGLAAYQTEWHNFCTNTWRWALDSGYHTSAIPRNAGYDMMVACAMDPSWTPPGGANAIFAGLQRVLVNGTYYSNTVNPSSFTGVGLYDVRETSYITRATAKICQFGGSYGLSAMTWCGYLAAQETYIWTQDLVNPVYSGSPDTTVLYAPIDSFVVGGAWLAPSAGNPPGSNKTGQGPWRDSGLTGIALADAYDAFVAFGDSTNAAIALDQVAKVNKFMWDYGVSPDGGSFYDVGNSSNGISDFITFNNYIPMRSPEAQTGYVGVTNGSPTVTANCFSLLYNSCPNFLRRFWNGAQIQLEGVNYTVSSIAGDGSTLTLTGNYAGSTEYTYNFGNTCKITLTNGSAAVTGDAHCKFTTFFADPAGAPAGSAYVGIVSGGCSTGGSCATTDQRVYGIAITDDTHATLVDHLTATNVNFVGTSTGGSPISSFIYAPQSGKDCGTSKSTYCVPGSRDLSEDVCYGFSRMYDLTASSTWKDRAKFCYNKQNGGQALGGAWGGSANGYTTYARPGTIKVVNGSTAVTGIGTLFASQFVTGDTILIGDNTPGIGWNNPAYYNAHTFYKFTVTVTNDTSMTLSGNWPGTTMNTTADSTGIFYNPTDSQWQGADGGYGVLSEPTPTCSFNFPPCGGGYDFPLKYGKSFGIADGAANTQMGIGILNITVAPSVGNIFNVSMKGISWK